MPPEPEVGDEDADDMDDVEEYEETICGGGYCGIGAASGLGGSEP